MMADDMENQARHDGAEAPPAAEAAQAALRTAGADAEALAAAIAERDEFKDRLLRTLAEMENLRRRTEREVADARTYAVTGFARDMLNVADNIRRALDSVPADARAGAEGALKGLIEGIDLTDRDLAKTLERHGVKVVDPDGQRFDPNRHQAMFEVPNAEVPNGTVVQVVQTGYVIGERTLRPALVGVSKGGPKPESNKDKPADAA
ncbi:MAG: nucleotide exchange factor GrpE [Methylorubrum populi]